MLRAADGVALALHRLAPVPVAAPPPVLLAHGAFTSHRVWLPGGATAGRGMASFLQARGHDAWLLDWRHHGASAREPGPFRWHFEDLIRHDAPAALAAVRHDTGQADVTWIGHSFGGAIGLAALARDFGSGPSAVVTLGTPDPVTGPARSLFARLTAVCCRLLGRFPARVMRLGPEDEAALVLSDWMMWNVRGRWSGSDGFDYLAALINLPTPLLSIAGSADRLFAPPGSCRRLAERLGGPRTTFAVVGPDLDHRGLLLDARADERCWPLIADWIARQAASTRVSA